jgi:hypothetical protein
MLRTAVKSKEFAREYGARGVDRRLLESNLKAAQKDWKRLMLASVEW